MKKENLKKIAVIAFVHIVEIVIMYFGTMWIWNNMAEEYRVWVIAAFLVAYALYFIVTTINDYKDIKYGIEPNFF